MTDTLETTPDGTFFATDEQVEAGIALADTIGAQTAKPRLIRRIPELRNDDLVTESIELFRATFHLGDTDSDGGPL